MAVSSSILFGWQGWEKWITQEISTKRQHGREKAELESRALGLEIKLYWKLCQVGKSLSHCHFKWRYHDVLNEITRRNAQCSAWHLISTQDKWTEQTSEQNMANRDLRPHLGFSTSPWCFCLLGWGQHGHSTCLTKRFRNSKTRWWNVNSPEEELG